VTSRAESPLFAAGLRRVAAPTIVGLGIIVVAGPVVAAVLVDRGHTMSQSVALGGLFQLAAILALPGRRPRMERWLTGAAYAGLSWLLALVLLQVFRSADVCTTARSVNTLDNAQLVVTAAAALLAVGVAFAVAAAARLPHAGIVVAVVAAFSLALLVVPQFDNSRLDGSRLVDAWDALGHHYRPNDSYSTVCGRVVNLESAPAVGWRA
jgi:hypothetical protein